MGLLTRNTTSRGQVGVCRTLLYSCFRIRSLAIEDAHLSFVARVLCVVARASRVHYVLWCMPVCFVWQKR